jgi:PST family polysaccharide transporter
VSQTTTDPRGADDPVAAGPSQRWIDTKGRTLRAFAARGVIINTVFDFGLSGLSLIRGFVIAAFLSRSDYGIWGILVVSLGVLARLKMVGVSDKYVQQDEPDQERAFQRAFTVELLITGAAIVPITAALPLIAVVYGNWGLVAPGLVLVTMLAANALQSPFWVYYREMDFVRQRSRTAIEPVVGFVVAIGLAIAGAGYWALVIGAAVGCWAGAITAILTSPYPLKWRYDKGSLRVYAKFSGPIFIATFCSVVLANSTVLASNAHLGLAAVGSIALAGNITAFTTRLDDLVSATLYPAVCAMQNRIELLRESFVKSNRLALMWAIPFGIGAALFCGDLVHFAIGDKWQPAVVLLQVTGVVAAINHVGFNWDDYFRARGETMPIAVASVASLITFLIVGLPLLFVDGLRGLAIGIAAQAVVNMLFRAHYLRRLFEGFAFVPHAVRAILPTVPAALVVLAARQLESVHRTAAMASGELVAYVLITVAATWRVEGSLVRELAGYLVRRHPPLTDGGGHGEPDPEIIHA